ncbi:hypothetical protein EUC41_08360 [Achromobacter denitrificans]|nr:hypothetical protein EUC41_08360 [Achromobacter denitrificans]
MSYFKPPPTGRGGCWTCTHWHGETTQDLLRFAGITVNCLPFSGCHGREGDSLQNPVTGRMKPTKVLLELSSRFVIDRTTSHSVRSE